MHIALFFESSRLSGGAYQQSVRTAQDIQNLRLNNVDITIFVTCPSAYEELSQLNWPVVMFKLTIFRRLIAGIYAWIRDQGYGRPLLGAHYFSLDGYFARYKIDLCYFLSPSYFSRFLVKLNFMTTVWDVCHHDEPSFPEVRCDGEFQRRELFLRNEIHRASAVFVDSKYTRNILFQSYGVNSSKIYVRPFNKSLFLDFDDEQQIPELFNCDFFSNNPRFIIYPAQFWSHKNHRYIIDAFIHSLGDDEFDFGCVFVGGEKNTKAEVKKYISENNLASKFFIMDYVEDAVLASLYRRAYALVMPSFFGPSNIPPLEAIQAKIPVIYGDISGAREFLGSAALYVNLEDPGHLVELLNSLNSPKLRVELIKLGRLRASEIALESESELRRAFRDFSTRHRCFEFKS